MQSRNLIVLMFLSLVFLSPLFVIAESDPYDDDTWYNFPSGVDYDVWVELKWGDKGDLIYWYIEVSGKIRFYFTNSSKDWADPIFSTVVKAEDSHEYNIALPYDDTFYFLMVNQIDDYVDIDGWYARDETGPDGDMWGLNTNFADEVLIGSIRDINCIFSDRFDIVNISLCENDVSVRTCTEPVDNMIEWTISDYKFTTLGVIEMAFKAKDQGGNIGIVSKTIKVVNKLSSPPAHSEPEYFDWIGIFEDYWYIMIPVGTLLGIGIILGLEKAGKLH